MSGHRKWHNIRERRMNMLRIAEYNKITGEKIDLKEAYRKMLEEGE